VEETDPIMVVLFWDAHAYIISTFTQRKLLFIKTILEGLTKSCVNRGLDQITNDLNICNTYILYVFLLEHTKTMGDSGEDIASMIL